MGLIFAIVIAIIAVLASAFVLFGTAAGDERGDASPMPAVWTLVVGLGIACAVGYTHFHPLTW